MRHAPPTRFTSLGVCCATALCASNTIRGIAPGRAIDTIAQYPMALSSNG